MSCLTEVSLGLTETDKKVVVNQTRLEAVLTRALSLTDGLPLAPLLDLHAQLTRIVHGHSGHLDRSTLPQVSSKPYLW